MALASKSPPGESHSSGKLLCSQLDSPLVAFSKKPLPSPHGLVTACTVPHPVEQTSLAEILHGCDGCVNGIVPFAQKDIWFAGPSSS